MGPMLWRSIAMGLVAWPAAGCDFRRPSPLVYEGSLVTVNVSNDNRMDVDIFALVGGTRHRIGHLASLEVMIIEIGNPLLPANELRLVVDPVGSTETYETPPILTFGATRVDLRVDDILGHTGYTVTYLEDDDSLIADT